MKRKMRAKKWLPLGLVFVVVLTLVAGCACPTPPPPPAPAAFSVSNLSIQPLEVQPNEAVTIAVSVANTGGTEGSYSTVLEINGVKEAEESLTIAAGESQDISFKVTKEKAGSYNITVEGLSGSFTVVAPPLPPASVDELIDFWSGTVQLRDLSGAGRTAAIDEALLDEGIKAVSAALEQEGYDLDQEQAEAIRVNFDDPKQPELTIVSIPSKPGPQDGKATAIIALPKEGTPLSTGFITNIGVISGDGSVIVYPSFFIRAVYWVDGELIWWHYWWYDSHNHPNWYYSWWYWHWGYYWDHNYPWYPWYTWYYSWFYWKYWWYWSTYWLY